MKLSRLLAVYKEGHVNDLCAELTGYTLNEKNLKYEDISEHWKFVGNNPSNASVINMLRKGEKGLIERITNGIDAVIEKKVSESFGTLPSNSAAVIKKAFPEYYERCEKIRKGLVDSNHVCDAGNQVMVAVSDGSRSSTLMAKTRALPLAAIHSSALLMRVPSKRSSRRRGRRSSTP